MNVLLKSSVGPWSLHKRPVSEHVVKAFMKSGSFSTGDYHHDSSGTYDAVEVGLRLIPQTLDFGLE